MISEEQKEKYAIIGQLVDLVQHLPQDRLEQLLEEMEREIMEASQVEGDRKNIRMSCMMSVDYADSERAFRDYIYDISTGGVFINTRESFALGEEIVLSMTFSAEGKAFKIPAEVVRKAPDGIGVKFKITSQVQEDIIESLMRDVGNKNKRTT